MQILEMPKLGVTMENGKIIRWRKTEGELVKQGEIIMEIEYEKARVEVESPYSGIVKKFLVEEGSEIPVGSPMAVFVDENEDLDMDELEKELEGIKYSDMDIKAIASKDSAKEEERISEQPVQAESEELASTSRKKVSPRARRLAKKKGVSLERISGTGNRGVITVDDVNKAVSDAEAATKAERPQTPDKVRVREVIKLSSIQKAMSKNMKSSWYNIPHFSQIIRLRADRFLKIKAEIDGISINDIAVKLIAMAISDNMIVNSTFDEENNEATIFEDINICVAMATDNGLVVPVVRNADQKPVNVISDEIRELHKKAQENKLSTEDISGGTITVSNLGYYGIEAGGPLISYPQGAIVFVGAINKEPVVDEETSEIKVGHIMSLSVAYDHRFIEGIMAANFTSGLKKIFEEFKVNQLFNF